MHLDLCLDQLFTGTKIVAKESEKEQQIHINTDKGALSRLILTLVTFCGSGDHSSNVAHCMFTVILKNKALSNVCKANFRHRQVRQSPVVKLAGVALKKRKKNYFLIYF